MYNSLGQPGWPYTILQLPLSIAAERQVRALQMRIIGWCSWLSWLTNHMASTSEPSSATCNVHYSGGQKAVMANSSSS